MCDFVHGQLLVSVHKDDPAGIRLLEKISSGNLIGYRIDEEMMYRLKYTAGTGMRSNINFYFYKLGVPLGEEIFAIGRLQFEYKKLVLEGLQQNWIDPHKHSDVLNREDYHLQVVPNSYLYLRHSPPATPVPDFTFTTTHDRYKSLIGWQAPYPGVTQRILILDTGIDSSAQFNVVSRHNYVDDAKGDHVFDDHGHGTAVSSIIHDLFPYAEFVIGKVADNTGRASEWDVLAALAADTKADLVNISLAFGLPSYVCPHCGRESSSSRSAVFENIIAEFERDTSGPILVAAAGNDGQASLSYPARFDSLVAIASVNRSLRLSAFTNHSTIDHRNQEHQNVFVLPGGESSGPITGPTEYIGTTSSGTKWYGTSMSTAYATGLIANVWSQQNSLTRAEILEYLRNTADRSVADYSRATHGNGLMRQ